MNKQKEFYLQSSIFYWHAEKWEMNIYESDIHHEREIFIIII